jgi:methyl-accepting chemotaxis protein
MTEETFRWVIAGGVAIATISIVVLVVMMGLLFKTMAQLKGRMEGMADRVEPVFDSVRFVINENAPKLSEIMTATKETASNVREISGVAKDQADRFGEIGRDITDRAKVQVARVDAAVDETVDQVQNLGSNVRVAVMKPMNEVSGVVAGIKAGVAAYAQGRRPDVTRVTQDEEMFI